MKTEKTKRYYSDPTLNRIANEQNWGRVFGESTMLELLKEADDEETFIADIRFELN